MSLVSFASLEQMENILGVKVGAATVFGILKARKISHKLFFDKDALLEECYGCSKGTTTGYMKVKTMEVIDKFLPSKKYKPTVIQI
ncbi:hypothetical protein [Pseudobacillus wudalianchiensis]|uniref:hypothetical protein n=1 Tax=Pseudobacillus wudalianchiensis TaxID=1743143 RepID=UPI003CCBCF99